MLRRHRWLALRVLLLAPLAVGAGAEPLPEGRSYGAPVTLERVTPLAEILGNPEHFAGESVLVRGRIADVCQKKGCWTVLRDRGDHLRVRFRDYGFFLPRDSLGAEAYAQGRVTVVTLSEREARHYAEESRGGDPAQIDGPQREVSFTASGVRLLGPEPEGQ